jgi:hypothetical protein
MKQERRCGLIGMMACLAGSLLTGTSACSAPNIQGGNSLTLYRNSATDANMRIHVASFDAAESRDYNRENCDVARGLWGGQPGVTVRYWCEEGRFKR